MGIPKEELVVGNRILLKGKTRHGKNRLNQHGAFWVVKEVSKFRGQPAVSLSQKTKLKVPKTTKALIVWFYWKMTPIFLYFGNIMTYKKADKKTGPNSWTIQVRENGKTKELFIELPRSTCPK